MIETSVLFQELSHLDSENLEKVSNLWNIKLKTKNKNGMIKQIFACMQDEFYIRGVIEKLSATQTTIYLSIIQSKTSSLMLKEVAKKIDIPPANTELELGVLCRYYLIYQRRNRKLLTNNLDKYYCFPENSSKIVFSTNLNAEKIHLRLIDFLKDRPVSKEWKKMFKQKEDTYTERFIEECLTKPELSDHIAKAGKLEKKILFETFLRGGIIDMNSARDLILSHKEKWQSFVPYLEDLGFLFDDYYLDERFIRILLMPKDLFQYILAHPECFHNPKDKINKYSTISTNGYDLFLNIKKLIVYIMQKGLELSKSGNIRQINLKESEDMMLRPDMNLFIEKSHIYQIELLLPIARLLDIVRIKYNNVVLRNNYEEILSLSMHEIIQKVLDATFEAENRSIVHQEVFEAKSVPLPTKEIWDNTLAIIEEKNEIDYYSVIAILIRNIILKSQNFHLQEFNSSYNKLRSKIMNSIFYMQIFGFIDVNYSYKILSLSNICRSFLKGKEYIDHTEDQEGAIIINPDMTVMAIPERLSINSLNVLKSFTRLKSFDNVYTLELDSQSFRQGILMKQNPQEFIALLHRTLPAKMSNNLIETLENWSENMPVLNITDDCVLVHTKSSEHMDLLLGQIAANKIVLEKINDTTIVIDSTKILDTITAAEKLELIVKLTR